MNLVGIGRKGEAEKEVERGRRVMFLEREKEWKNEACKKTIVYIKNSSPISELPKYPYKGKMVQKTDIYFPTLL